MTSFFFYSKVEIVPVVAYKYKYGYNYNFYMNRKRIEVRILVTSEQAANKFSLVLNSRKRMKDVK